MQADDTEYMRLVAAERQAWTALEGRLPGNPGFDKGAWDDWRRAIKAVAAELDRHRGSSGGRQLWNAGRPRA